MDKLLAEALDGLSSHSLSIDRFEYLVDYFWAQDAWIQSGKAASAYVSNVLQEIPGLSVSDYGNDTQILFKSHHLYGEEGTSGAIHIQAPPEEKRSPLLADKNRAPHAHGSGRISIITMGKAIFYIHRNINGCDYVIEAPVYKNDVIFCPSGCAHTFDAGTMGFSLVSAMAAYHPPQQR